MKKMKLIIALVFIGALSLIITSCGEKYANYKEAVKDNEYANYKEAVKDNDFEAAHMFLDENYKEFEDVWNKYYDELDYTNNYRSKIEKAAIKYSQAASYILCAEARYLISNYGEEATERIEFLFNEIVVLGEKVVGTGYHPGGVKDRQEACVKLDCYKQTVKYNNELCNVVLNLAINNHNEELAKLALSYYMQDWINNWGDDVSWIDSDKEAAQKKYDEAVDSDVFK